MHKKPDLQNLPLKEKLEFIWDYYRFQILAVVCTLIVVISMVVSCVSYRDPQLRVIMVNSAVTAEPSDEGFRDFFRDSGIPISEDDPEVIRLSLSADSSTAYQDAQQLAALFIAGGQEIMMGDEAVMTDCAQDGTFVDLRTLFPEDFLEAHREQLFYSDEDGTVEPYPCGFILTDCPWLQENDYYYDSCLISIPHRSNYPENAVKFIMYLLS